MPRDTIAELAETTELLLAHTDKILVQSRRHLDMVQSQRIRADSSLSFFESKFRAKPLNRAY